ncbi:MAG TPA: gluconate 2-dehydrogenase subunit 3 family protein [Chloroflexota bacterium]|nr:gluconate 2-dehydrogenase subunit 3 family protein [Chloroflexota bacterium]
MPEPWFVHLEAFAEEMIPSDDLPGAREAGTAEAAANVLRTAPGQEQTIRGLEALHRLGFADMPPAQRLQTMEQLAKGAPPPGWTAADPPAGKFWQALRALTVSLFYGSDTSRQVTGFPGPSLDSGGYVRNIVERQPR